MSALLLSAVLAGLVGGLHCAAMCGGFAAAAALRDAQILRPRRALIARQLTYHAGRIASYAVLGALFGAVGQSAIAAAKLAPLQQALYAAANVVLLLLATGIAMPTTTTTWLGRVGAGAFAGLIPRLRPLLRGNGTGSRVALGALWGLVPCTLVYSMLPLALFSGGAWQGAVVMMAFGAGTLPHLVGSGVILMRLGARWRRGAGTVIAAFALLGLYRALFVPEALGQGAFCLF